MKPGLEVIKLEFILRLKIKCNDWLLADTCPQAANHFAFFESETLLKLCNIEAWSVIKETCYERTGFTEKKHVSFSAMCSCLYCLKHA